MPVQAMVLLKKVHMDVEGKNVATYSSIAWWLQELPDDDKLTLRYKFDIPYLLVV